MAIRIKISDTKAYRVEGIEVSGKKMVSIRQMYATKKDPEWKPAKQGLTVAVEESDRLIKAIKAIASGDDFKTVEFNK